MYLNERRYQFDRPILYNNNNVNSLYQAYINPEAVSKVGEYKKIPAGSFLTSDNRLLARANIISPYTAADPSVIVDNPWVFLPGDVLYEIGDSSFNLLAEQQAVNNATQELGTVTAVNPGVEKFQVTLTPSAIAIGDVFNLQFEEMSIAVTATTTDVADLLQLLSSALTDQRRSHFSSIDAVDIAIDATSLTITAKETGQIFTTSGSVVGTGALSIQVAGGAGTLTITPAAGNNSHDIGAKIGVINARPLGIVAHTKYLTDDWGLELVGDLAAYDTANINTKAVPYLDGNIVSALPTLKFMPTYGS
ncbi:MAG: hypothetical protein QNJ72_31360 [Pleurocapsa sp. MO_226.B13]|nr:hypothetical protein [Pleurocapsa sp. MO_226.B13]